MKSTLFRKHPHPSPWRPHTQHTHESDQMPRWRPPLCLSLSPRLSLVYQHPPMCATRATHQPLNLNLPALPVYKYSPNHARNSWLSETLRVAAEHPLRLAPSIVSLFFQKTSHTTHLTRFFRPPPHPLWSLFPTVVVHSLPVACIFRLPKWFARLKSLRTNTMLYPGAKKSRWCGALLRPARLWIPPRRRMRGEMRFSSANSSAGIRRRCGASFTRVLWKGYPTLRSEGSGSSPGLSFYTLFWQVSSLFLSALHPKGHFIINK